MNARCCIETASILPPRQVDLNGLLTAADALSSAVSRQRRAPFWRRIGTSAMGVDLARSPRRRRMTGVCAHRTAGIDVEPRHSIARDEGLWAARDPQLAQVDATGLGAHSSEFMPRFLNSHRGDEHVARGGRRPLKLRITKRLCVVVRQGDNTRSAVVPSPAAAIARSRYFPPFSRALRVLTSRGACRNSRLEQTHERRRRGASQSRFRRRLRSPRNVIRPPRRPREITCRFSWTATTCAA